MTVDVVISAAALVAILSVAVVYGTDTFCATVLRPALAGVDDYALVAVMGRVHRYGDKRMPIPGALGLAATVVCLGAAILAAQWVHAAAASTALIALVVWLVLYARVSAPINRQLTSAADAGRALPNGRALQTRWDRIIGIRAVLQGLALAALSVVLMS